jgi:hypothetical protein
MTAADKFVGSDLWHSVQRMKAELRAEANDYIDGMAHRIFERMVQTW